MDPEASKKIYDRSDRQLKLIIQQFNRDIFDEFQAAFKELTKMYHTKSRHQKYKINQNQVTIQNMQLTIDDHKKKLADFVNMLGSHFGLSKPVEEEKVQTRNLNDPASNNSVDSENTEMRMQRRSNAHEDNQIASKSNSLSQNRNLYRNQEEPKVQETVTYDYIQNHPPIGRPIGKNQIILDEDEEESQQSKSEKIVRHKNPLRYCTKHTTWRVSFTPNITKLSYTHFPYQRNDPFDVSQIEFLDRRDLRDITSVQISRQKMNNKMLTLFTELDFSNLRALRIDYNNINDISPIKNLNIKNLQDLNVSFNPLGQKSAQFLAEQPFDQLIHLTVSFDTGLDEECWDLILKNNMDNYPKIEAVDICNASHLQDIRKRIEQCLYKKSLKQRTRQLRAFGKTKYSEDYKIKIRWIKESRQIMDTYGGEQLKQINQNWEEQVGYERLRISRLKARYDTRCSPYRRKPNQILQEDQQKRERPRTRQIQKESKQVGNHRGRKGNTKKRGRRSRI